MTFFKAGQNFCLNVKTRVGEKKRAVYLDLIHVHDSPGGSLGAQTVADALLQSHAIELAVVCRPPPENTGTWNKICDKDQRAQMPPNTACWFSECICFCTRSFLCWLHGWHQLQSDRRSAHSSNVLQCHTYYQVREVRAEFVFGLLLLFFLTRQLK